MLLRLLDETVDRWIRSYTDPILNELGVIRRAMMATFAEVSAKIDEINTAIAEEREEVQGLLEAMRQQIQVLQDQLAAGQLVTQEQLDSLAVAADQVVARVRQISEPV